MSLTNGINLDNFFGELVQDLEYEFASDDSAQDIMDFLEREVDMESWLGPGGKLNDRQQAILKAYDGLPLDDNEQGLMQAWSALDRTTYDPLLPPSKRQSFILECGRNGSKCTAVRSSFLLGSGLQHGYELLNKVLGQNLFYKGQSAKESQAVAQQLGIVGKDFAFTEEVSLEGKSKKAKTKRFYVKGLTATKRVVTDSGYEIEATPEHRIKVMGEDGQITWKYLENILVGDHVAIHRATALFPTEPIALLPFYEGLSDKDKTSFSIDPNLTLNADIGYYLGLLVANGSWTRKADLELTHHSQDKVDYLTHTTAAAQAFGLSNNLETLKVPTSRQGCRTRIKSGALRRFFDKLGFVLDSEVDTKAVPDVIRKSPREVQAAFLSGLFDGDGSIEHKGRLVTFSTASKFLASDVQLMLLNFGIVSTVKVRIINDKPYYLLGLRGRRSLRVFSQDIQFKLQRKQKPVEVYLKDVGSNSGNTEAIPYQIEWLKKLRDTLPDNTGKQPGSHHGGSALLGTNYTQGRESSRNLRLEYKAIVGNAIKPSSNEHFSSNRLSALLDFAKEFCQDPEAVQHFEHILDCDYYYTPVVSVEDSEAFCVDLWVPGHEQYVCQGMTNHNTFLGAIIIGYEFYKLCMLKNPQQFFGVAASTLISIYCLAPAASQVKKTIFGQAKAFLNYIPKIKRLIDNKSIMVGEEQIKYDEKLLYIYAGNSKGSSQVGSRVILLVMDEVARFENKDGNSNALELWSNVGVSGITFGEHARRLAVSSAWCEGDAIQRLYLAAKGDQSWIGFRLRTWDLNPTMTRDNPIIASEYNLNPASAKLEFEGDRTANNFGFFSEMEILEAFTGHTKANIEPIRDGNQELVKLKINDVEPAPGIQTYMHLDPAFVHDAYGMVFGHGEMRDGEKIVVIDGIAAWEPDGGSVVSIMNVYDIIFAINRVRPIYKVTTDHAQQHETIQRLRMQGISASSRFWSNRVQVEIYDFTRKLFHERRIILPKNSPWTTLLKSEMMGIIHDKEKNKILHSNDGCFVGETRIPLLDGTRPMISELVGKEVWVYSCKPDGTIVPGKARGRKTKQVTELLDVVLDNGAIIRCTPEHPFMLRNGGYMKAEDIVPGFTRLMPIKFQWPIGGGYEKVSSIKGRAYLTHHMSLNYPDLGNEYVVHHINHNKVDNRPENLEIVSKVEHTTYHAVFAHENDQEYRKKLSEGTIRFNKLPETREKRSKHRKSLPNEYYKNQARNSTFFRANVNIDSLIAALEHGASNPYQAAIFLGETRNTIVRVLKDENFSDWSEFEVNYAEHKDIYAGTFSFKGKIPLSDPTRARTPKVSILDIQKAVLDGLNMRKDVAEQLQCSEGTIQNVLRRNGYQSWRDYIQGGLGQNHKVRDLIKVTLDEPIDVYDLEVDEWDNFALAAGVIVHNSKDILDCLCSVAWEIAGNAAVHQSMPRLVNNRAVINKRYAGTNEVMKDESFGSNRKQLVRRARSADSKLFEEFDF